MPKKAKRPRAAIDLQATYTKTVADLLHFLAGDDWDKPDARILAWPPDAFAVVATVLRDSGAYVHVTTEWPPCGTRRVRGSLRKGCLLTDRERKALKNRQPGVMLRRCDGKPWAKCTKVVGQQWQEAAARGAAPPPRIRQWWAEAVALSRGAGMRGINNTTEPRNTKLVERFLLLLAAADEASVGFGLSSDISEQTEAGLHTWVRAYLHLFSSSRTGKCTLCEAIDWASAVVLPKAHTPQTGLTIRSLSHNLALMPRADVDSVWLPPLNPVGDRNDAGYNILLVPWPFAVVPRQFHRITPKVVRNSTNIRNFPETYGFFSFRPRALEARDFDRFRCICREARRMVGTIHAAVFPECAFLQEEVARVAGCFRGRGLELFVAGVSGRRRDELPQNYAVIHRWYPQENVQTRLSQPKHHRWLMDRPQLEQYGLGSVLDVGELPEGKRWVEHMAIQQRTVHFIPQRDWLTVSVLVCEDLTRPDPLGDVLRAVGPNLVIAILQDAPQLERRWSARAATVLADDPGSCVLTLTSLGMALLSHPMGGEKPSRAIALWRQPNAGTREIRLPQGSDGLVLSLAKATRKEYSADGRDDGGVAGFPVLAGIHAVKT